MAIRLVTGKPGSGKTYFAVSHILKKYCNLDRHTKLYTLKKNHIVITNIKELKLPHVDLNSILQKNNVTIDKFFTNDVQEKIAPKKNVLYIIDEAQQYFHKRYYNVDTFYYFQTHRHLGHDIYLITQSVKLLPLQITELTEVEVHAQPRSLRIANEFSYQIISSGEVLDRKILKRNQRIFSYYKSMSKSEAEKTSNPFRKYIILCAVLLVLAAYGFYRTFLIKIPDGNITLSESVTKPEPQPNFNNNSRPTTNIYNGRTPAERQITYQTNPLSYIDLSGQILVLDPLTKTLIPIQMLKIKYNVYAINGTLRIYGRVPDTIPANSSAPPPPEGGARAYSQGEGPGEARP